jgi:hypothetical protein
MDSTISKGIMYGDYPPKGVYFTVVVGYNPRHPLFKNGLETPITRTNPINSFPAALITSDKIMEELTSKKFSDTTVTEMDPEETNGYHYILHDEHQLIIARVGVDTHDYRNEVLN